MMPDTPPPPKPPQPLPILPRNMRPRSTANAEINAQEGDKVRRDMGLGYPLAPNQSYNKGGAVPAYCKGGKVIKHESY